MTVASETQVRLPVALGERVDVMPVVEWLRPQIEAALPAIERDRRLPQELADAIYDAGVNRVALPREFGGLELHILDILELTFELSRISGSVGWASVVIQHGGDPLLPPDVMRELLDRVDGRWIVSGSHGRIGTARQTDGGYILNGDHSFASGGPWATYLTVAVRVIDPQGEPVSDPVTGEQIELEMIVPKESVTWLDRWDSMGLRGTGSGEFKVEDLFVEERFAYKTLQYFDYHDRALYKAGFAGTTPVALLGMAQGAIDAFAKLTLRPKRTNSSRNRAALLGEEQAHQMSIGNADALIQSTYQWIRQLSQESVDIAFSDDGDAKMDNLIRLCESITYGAEAARQAVTAVYLAAGSDSIMVGRGIERYFRDVYTGGQHTGSLPPTMADYGRHQLSRLRGDEPQNLFALEQNLVAADEPASAADNGDQK